MGRVMGRVMDMGMDMGVVLRLDTMCGKECEFAWIGKV